MKFRSPQTCPYCRSGDIWQPHVRTWLDRFVERFGFEQFECRKCRRRLFLKKPRPAAPRYKRDEAAESVES